MLSGVSCGLDDVFFCDDSNCIANAFVCDEDGFLDCIDGTDEATCAGTAGPRCDPSTMFPCNSGRCIDRWQVCDGTSDCGSSPSDDEVNCAGRVISN